MKMRENMVGWLETVWSRTAKQGEAEEIVRATEIC